MARAAKAKLARNEIGTVVAMLEAWNGPLTWEVLVERVDLVLGRRFTRQALDGHPQIKLAFQTQKTRLRNIRASIRAGRAPDGDLPAEMTVLVQRADALQARVDRLQATVDAYDAKFATWLHHARILGISEEVLNAPLPPVDRAADPARTRPRK